jgi:hypothetical protein
VIRAFAVLVVAIVFAAAATTQEKLKVSVPQPGTIRMNDTSVVSISIEGGGAKPRMPKLPAVAGLKMRFLPMSTRSEMFYNGRRRVTRVSVQFGIELRPLHAGSFTVPPFPIWTGTKNQLTPELKLEVRQDLISKERSWIDVQFEQQRVYVHEPVRVTIHFAVQQGVRLAQEFHERRRYLAIFVVADWLAKFPAGETIDLPQPRGDLRAVVCNNELSLATFQGNFERKGQRWQRFTMERAFLPSKIGTFVLSAPELRFHAVRSSRYGRRVEKYAIRGKPLKIEVLPIPEVGRPSPFFGAVGRFTITAGIDRDRVRFGDSFKLTLIVRGQGNFEFLRLPELQDLEGFHKRGTAEAQRDGDRVVVTYDLTPLSTDVKVIPPIAWNYFDTTPGVEKFVEVATSPLPIVVDAIANAESIEALPEVVEAAVTLGVDDIFDLPSFAGPPVVIATPPLWQRWSAVLAPWLLVLLVFAGFRSRQRAAQDVTGKRVRGARKQFEAALQRGDEVFDAVVAYVGDRLDVPPAAVISPELAQRLAENGLDDAVAAEVAAMIERGTSARYGGGQALTCDDARGLVKRLEAIRFGARSWLPFLLLPMMAVSAADLQAQETHAVRAYRAGDYVAADVAFAQAYQADADRLFLRARGNCLFRLGDLPRALWAYESARLASPRDDELLANLRLVRTRLELPDKDAGFGAEIARLLQRYTVTERALACLMCMLLAAGLLVFGWRRIGCRWLAAICLLPGTVLALDIVWLTPFAPVQAVALESLLVTAEPREGMEPVAKVRAGAIVALLGSHSGEFVRIDASGRSGYVAAAAVAVIE